MKPMGLKPFKFPSKTDCHPPKGFINWWEAIISKNGKSRERREAKKEISDSTNLMEDKSQRP